MPKSKHRDERPRAQLDWDAVRVFLAVAEARSINKAAAELKIQASSVSRKIDGLEKSLEVTLFHRRRTGMVLTDAGEDLFTRARSMQHFADDIERSVRSRDRREEGMVTIAAPDALGSLWVAPRVSDFLNRNPKIQISLDCVVGPAALEGDVRPDITISLDKSLAEVGDDTMRLGMMHYVFVASPAYLETYGTPRSMASAAGDHRTLRQTGQVSQRETWGARASAVETLAQYSFETNSSPGALSAIRGGAGVATVPTYVFTLAPELVIIGQEQSVPINMWLIVHQEARNAVRVTRVVEWLKAIFDARTNPWFRDEFIRPEDFTAEEQAPAAPVRRPKR